MNRDQEFLISVYHGQQRIFRHFHHFLRKSDKSQMLINYLVSLDILDFF